MSGKRGDARDQIDANMVLTPARNEAAERLAERMLRRRDRAAGVPEADTAELLAMLGIEEDLPA